MQHFIHIIGLKVPQYGPHKKYTFMLCQCTQFLVKRIVSKFIGYGFWPLHNLNQS